MLKPIHAITLFVDAKHAEAFVDGQFQTFLEEIELPTVVYDFDNDPEPGRVACDICGAVMDETSNSPEDHERGCTDGIHDPEQMKDGADEPAVEDSETGGEGGTA